MTPLPLTPSTPPLQEAAAALQLARERLAQARTKKAEFEAAASAAQKTSAADTRAAAQASAELDAHSKAVSEGWAGAITLNPRSTSQIVVDD